MPPGIRHRHRISTLHCAKRWSEAISSIRYIHYLVRCLTRGNSCSAQPGFSQTFYCEIILGFPLAYQSSRHSGSAISCCLLSLDSLLRFLGAPISPQLNLVPNLVCKKTFIGLLLLFSSSLLSLLNLLQLVQDRGIPSNELTGFHKVFLRFVIRFEPAPS